MRVHDKLENIDRLDDIKERLEAHQLLDSNLAALIALEENFPPEMITPDLNKKKCQEIHKDVAESTREQIHKSLRHLKETFSLIFKALLVLSGSQQVPNSPMEQENVGKRSKEFEKRLKRNAFEIKQQVIC